MQNKIKSLFALTLLCFISLYVPIQAQRIDPLPQRTPLAAPKRRLVVAIIVDQFRYDYLERFSDLFTNGGFRRLVNQGAFFTDANYDYVPTFTAPGHASIFTGSVPALNGIVGNLWYDRAAGKARTMVSDTEARLVTSRGPVNDREAPSPRSLIGTTISDQIRLSNNFQSKVVAISYKDRSAILPGGHRPNGAYWFNSDAGEFVTSDYYSKELPSWVKKFNSAQRPDQYFNIRWDRLLPTSAYRRALATALPQSRSKAQKKSPPKKTPPKKTAKTTARPAAATPKETPAAALERARNAAAQNERIALLEKFLVAHRNSAEEAEAREMLIRDYALRGEQYLREGNPQRATRDFKAAFRFIPAPITDRWFGQFIFPMPVAMNAFGFRPESAALMRSFEGRFAGDANRLIQIGFFYIQIEAPLEAVRVLEGVVKSAPDDHRAHNALGTAYLINLRLDEAALEFERAIEINPRDEFANLNLANLARSVGDHQRAVRFYRQQLAAKREDAEARAGLVISLLALGRDEEAEEEMKRAFELAPEDYRFPTQLAYYYTTRKKLQLARPLVERAARIAPRYAWAHIVKANIDALEGKYGDALSTIITAQTLGSFPTLNFELVKALMLVDGYDQALEVMGNAFAITEEGEFSTLLGGVLPARSPRMDLLLERERQASLFLNEHPTTALQYRLAESLGRIEHYLKVAAGERVALAKKSRRAGADESQSTSRPRRVAPPVEGELSAGSDAGLAGAQELMQAITTFTTLDDGRQPFRMVWAARKLTESSIALDAAAQLARRAIALADSATEPDGSMRDAPLLDRQGRRAVFLGRAYDALGWALFKKGEIRGAISNLTKSVDIYPDNPERKGAMWRLAVAMEEGGDQQRALDLYIASYDPETPTSSSRKAQIESLYKKLNGSLNGLEDKLKKP